MKSRSIELFLGLAIILIVCSFSIYTYFLSINTSLQNYTISANFNNIGSLTEGSKVVINGYEIGTVSEIKLLYPNYKIKVIMKIRNDIKIPINSVLSIKSSGLFDSPSISITPGNSENFIVNDVNNLKTKDWVSLEDKIGDVLFSVVGN